MLGQFTVLPLLKGWEWGDIVQSTNINLARGAAPIETEIKGKLGWYSRSDIRGLNLAPVWKILLRRMDML